MAQECRARLRVTKTQSSSNLSLATGLASLPFPEAARQWLDSRKDNLAPKTFHEYTLNIQTLSAFFAEVHLSDINGESIRAYQKISRSATAKDCPSNSQQ